MPNTDILPDFDFEIDKYSLDEELVNQVNEFAIIGDKLAEAEHKVRVYEQKEKEIRSRLILEVHAGDHDDHFDGKPTAQSIEAFFRINEDHINAKRLLIKAQKKADALRQRVFSCQAKRSALELLVKLFLTGYYTSDNNVIDNKPKNRKRRTRRNQGE